MNHVINSIFEDALPSSSISHTNPALVHDVLWRSLEQALKATTEVAQTQHTRACLRIFAEIDTLSYLDKADAKLAAALGKAFFESRSIKDVEAFWKLLLIKQLLFELSVRSAATHIASKASYSRPPLTLAPTFLADQSNVRISLGLLCKETDQLKHSVVQALQKLAQHVEDHGLKKTYVTQQMLLELYNAVWSGSNGIDIESQIFYADSVYDALPDAYQALGLAGEEKWLTLYTWLYGDKDGRPYDTNQHTETLVIALETAIRNRYIADINSLIKDAGARHRLEEIRARLDKGHPECFEHPSELAEALSSIRFTQPAAIDRLLLRVNTFGFHYLEIEFRENAEMFSNVVDEILSSQWLQDIGQGEGRYYRDLDEPARQAVLAQTLDEGYALPPATLWQEYLQRTAAIYEEKALRYKGQDYIALLEQDPSYIRMYDARNAVERFEMIDNYRDRMKIHGIAEYTSALSVLEVLFLTKAAQVRDGIDIALQPEDLGGAEQTLRTVHEVYENPVYRQHLESRGNRQYITFGPSDTGKQGGKGMHKLNMAIANQHRLIAARYGIEVIAHVIMGGEHARCNGVIAETMQEFGALDSAETRFMLAGCAEMRSHLLTRNQSVNFLSQLYLMHAEPQPQPSEEVIESRIQRWTNVVHRYQAKFFEHPALPSLLRDMARFDVVRATAKGTRPPSRIFNIKVFESRPDAIRAIPWTRALLASGLHSELIGVGQFAAQPAAQLLEAFHDDGSFHNYVKGMAYSIARTDLKCAWLTLTGSIPDKEHILELAAALKIETIGTAEQLLASLHLEVVEGKRFVYKATTGVEPQDPWKIKDGALLNLWPSLKAEVHRKEKSLRIYRLFLIYSKINTDFIKSSSLNDFYSGFLAAASTDTGLVDPASASHFIW
ncbi:phosphoenolpyruvate carboxylase [Pseudomonas chlororaphis subsp. aurantiaca]|uniref:phosphoenolpyruvate carboxylase n=1 Tax=Pseudomonas chlororaphis TaxID=587753 RepID=UPI001B311880|nr:phosphoenolpyruvate carboxylase [Pseudomonas chlororaphis]QTT88943.1 phosphoenolpyruvate carboxylase [Pseudomonas chlororaphis]WMJ02905.1 phosphoenolpyruvate carboxylase [Pseudomonas chlororaphis subsp. aurantiaca]